MLLPNKLFSYNKSVLSRLPIFLKALDEPKKPKELYYTLKNYFSTPMEFMDILDCLYALQTIDINEEGEIFIC